MAAIPRRPLRPLQEYNVDEHPVSRKGSRGGKPSMGPSTGKVLKESTVPLNDHDSLRARISELMKNLEKAHDKIIRRDETIAALSKRKEDGPGKQKDLEDRLGDLVRLHESSKRTHEREVASLKEENTRLTQSLDEERRKAEAKSLRETQDEAKQETRSEDDRITYLEDMLDTVSAAYGALHHSTVSKHHHQRVKEEVLVLREEISSRLRIETALSLQVRDLRENVIRLEESVAFEREQRSIVESQLEQMRVVANDAAHREEPRLAEAVQVPDDPGVSVFAALADLERHHGALASFTSRLETRDVLYALRQTRADIEKIREEQADVQRLRISETELREQCDTLRASKETLDAALENKIEELRIQRERGEELARSRNTLSARLKAAEGTAAGERAALRRANEGTMRWKSAETALEDELSVVQDKLREAERFEDLYHQLLEDYQGLALREATAQEELDDLTRQNAVLMGHGTGDQKITYVENVRRELAIAKSELASTRHLLNAANDRITDLTREVESYKSIDTPALGESTRTRVVRRVPEGSWLRTSMRGSRSGNERKSS